MEALGTSSGRRGLFAIVALLSSALVAGLVAVAKVDGVGPLAQAPFTTITSLPIAVFPVLLLAVGLVFATARIWWLGLAAFFLWIPFEDLVRKFADNDIRVYAVKDLLLAVALLGIGPRLIGCWRRPLGNVWFLTCALLFVAVALSARSSLIDIRLPLIGLSVRFLFVVLVPVGVYLGKDGDRLRKALVPLGVLGAAVCAIGLAQTVLGPHFLNPRVADPFLDNLVVVKGAVTRPAGPFVDVGRFASMTTVTVVLGLCMVRLARTRRDAFIGGVVVATAVAAAFASGGRTALLFAIALTVFGLGISRATPQGPRGRLPIVASLGAVVLTVVVLGGVFSSVTSTRIDFYTRTLNPVSTGSEVVPRIRYYTANAIYGVQKGGITGRGTGTESVGKQYLGEDAPDSVTESGWGSVAAEWGFFGLLLWIAWTVAWIGRTFAAVRRGRETAAGPITPVIAFFVVLTLVVLHSVGSQGFDNYITNVYFWLLSGVAFAALIANEPPIAGAVDRSPELQSIV